MSPAARRRGGQLLSARGGPIAKFIALVSVIDTAIESRLKRNQSLLLDGEEIMAQQLDTRDGWCCDGRTWKEHAQEGGQCCQSKGTQIAALPAEGQQKAKQRLAQAGSR
jgi:hypothetical protein